MKRIHLAGCVIIENESILLIQSKKNWYELPGGKINDKEEPEETAVRELKEELSCEIKIIIQLDTKDFEENGLIITYHRFLAKIMSGQRPRIGEPEKFDHYRYIPLKKLTYHQLSPNMQNLAAEFRLVPNYSKCPYCKQRSKKNAVVLNVLPPHKRGENKPISTKQDIRVCLICGGAVFHFFETRT